MSHQHTFAARGMRTRSALHNTPQAIGRTAAIVALLSALGATEKVALRKLLGKLRHQG